MLAGLPAALKALRLLACLLVSPVASGRSVFMYRRLPLSPNLLTSAVAVTFRTYCSLHWNPGDHLVQSFIALVQRVRSTAPFLRCSQGDRLAASISRKA